MSNLPIGWEDRNNKMSEMDIKLGGMAANRFTSKGLVNGIVGSKSGAYDSDTTGVYKSSDEVRKHYLHQQEQSTALRENNDTNSNGSKSTSTGGNDTSTPGQSSLPDFWGQRQKARYLEAQQIGAFSSRGSQVPAPSSNASSAPTNVSAETGTTIKPEIALVQVSSSTLNTLALTLESNPSLVVPLEERAEFAKAMKRVMDAMAKCPSK